MSDSRGVAPHAKVFSSDPKELDDAIRTFEQLLSKLQLPDNLITTLYNTQRSNQPGKRDEEAKIIMTVQNRASEILQHAQTNKSNEEFQIFLNIIKAGKELSDNTRVGIGITPRQKRNAINSTLTAMREALFSHLSSHLQINSKNSGEKKQIEIAVFNLLTSDTSTYTQQKKQYLTHPESTYAERNKEILQTLDKVETYFKQYQNNVTQNELNPAEQNREELNKRASLTREDSKQQIVPDSQQIPQTPGKKSVTFAETGIYREIDLHNKYQDNVIKIRKYTENHANDSTMPKHADKNEKDINNKPVENSISTAESNEKIQSYINLAKEYLPKLEDYLDKPKEVRALKFFKLHILTNPNSTKAASEAKDILDSITVANYPEKVQALGVLISDLKKTKSKEAKEVLSNIYDTLSGGPAKGLNIEKNDAMVSDNKYTYRK